MPQLAPITVNDGSADTTFQPRGVDQNGTATVKASTGIPIGDKRIVLGRSRTAGGKEKISLKIVVPVVQDAIVNGISKPTVVRTGYADVQFTFDSTSNTEERVKLLNFVYSLVGNATTNGLVGNLDTMY